MATRPDQDWLHGQNMLELLIENNNGKAYVSGCWLCKTAYPIDEAGDTTHICVAYQGSLPRSSLSTNPSRNSRMDGNEPRRREKKSKAASESIKNVNLEEGEDIARLIGGGRRRGLVTPALAIHLRQRRPEIASSSVLRPESAIPASGSSRHLF